MIVKIGDFSLPVLKDGFSWAQNCGAEGKHATSSVSFRVRPIEGLVSYLMTAEGYVSATLVNGDTTLFTGVIRPYTSHYYKGAYQGSISLELMDLTEAMHIYIWPEPEDGRKDGYVYTDVWTGKTLAEVVSALFALAGRTCATIDSTESLPYFKLKGEAYLDNIIAELLYEYGLDYRWKADGTAETFSTFVDGQTVNTIADIRGQLNVQRSDDTIDGLKVSWKEWSYEVNKCIYSFDSGNLNFGTFMGIPNVKSSHDLTGKLYTGLMHDSFFNSGATMPDGNLWTWFWDGSGLKNKEGEAVTSNDVLYVKTDASRVYVELLDEEDVTYSVTLESYDVNGMRMWIDYSGTFDDIFGTGWTWKVKAYGDVALGVEAEQSYNITGSNPEEITLEYRLSAQGSTAVSEDFVKQLYARLKHAKITYTFDSQTSYVVGGFYNLYGNTVRIISGSQDSDGNYSYTAEGCKPFADMSIGVSNGVRSFTRSTPQSAYELAREYGFTGTEEQYVYNTLPKPKYYGKLDAAPNSNLLEGDYYLSSADGKVYTYDGSTWSSVDWTADTLASGWGEKFAVALPDMIQLGSNNYTTATILGFFKVLCADEGFIKFLKAYRLIVGSGSDTSGFKFECYDHDTNGNAVTPVIRAVLNGGLLFEIKTDGSGVYVKGNGEFSGKINASEGTFNGQLNTPGIVTGVKTESAQYKTVTTSTADGSSSDGSIYNALASYMSYFSATTVYCTLDGVGDVTLTSETQGADTLQPVDFIMVTDSSGNGIAGAARFRSAASGTVSGYLYSGFTTARTFRRRISGGDWVKLLDVQVGSTGLSSGMVYKTSDGFLKIV